MVSSEGDEFSAAVRSYHSPLIMHAVVRGLKPRTRYYYTATTNGKSSAEASFTTLPAPRTHASAAPPANTYPLRIGLLGDVGQTANSTATRNHTMANKPDVIFFAGGEGACLPGTHSATKMHGYAAHAGMCVGCSWQACMYPSVPCSTDPPRFAPMDALW